MIIGPSLSLEGENRKIWRKIGGMSEYQSIFYDR